jgi:ketosteroid isomerase-like protein
MKRAGIGAGIAACVAILLGACQARVPLTETALPPVAGAAQEWAAAVSACNVPRIMRLYDADAVMWDPTTRTLLDSPAAIRQHYERLCAAAGGVTPISVAEQRPRVLGAVAVNAGTYTIAGRAGETPLPVRFSFAYRLGVDGWRIVNHHASAFPPPVAPR